MGRRKKSKKIDKIIYLISIIIISILSYLGLIPEELQREKIDIAETITQNITIDEGKLNILFFDVGQADSSLIISDGKTMLIDSGNKDDGDYLVSQIKALNINKIDYVIGTHVHEDHIRGNG